MQNGNPFNLELIHFKEVENAKLIESTLHDKYRDKNVRLEWFELNEEDLEYIKNI